MNTFSLQTRLYSGPGSLKVLSRFSHKHIWIICDVFLARSPLIDTLHQALPDSNRLSIFSEITPDPTIQTVVKGIAQMQTLRPDVVIGFGGGSALDAAKAIVWFDLRRRESRRGRRPAGRKGSLPPAAWTNPACHPPAYWRTRQK